MFKINSNLLNLKNQYVFNKVSQEVKKFKKTNPNVNLVNLGIGDVSLPISKFVLESMKNSLNEMCSKNTFKGYGPYEGYEFLRKKIQINYKKVSKIDIELDEIFIGCGSKEDISGILDLFSNENKIAIPSPVYPAYLDVNIMNGSNIELLEGNEENCFLINPDKNKKFDIIYLCSPNNPTGVAYDYDHLKAWVDYALENNSIILYDGAYEAFIEEHDIPKSIYEISGSDRCAIEFRSFSKNAGFTGIRCSYIVIPKNIYFENNIINNMWKRRISSKTNGVSYITQIGAEATFSQEGEDYIKKCINYYKKNIKTISKILISQNIKIFGQKNSPYIWLKCPGNKDSWQFFDYLLKNFGIVGIPGIGFGKAGEGYFRFSGFEDKEKIDFLKEKFKFNTFVG